MECYYSKNIAIIVLLLVLIKQYNDHPKVTETNQGNSSGTENEASSSPSPGVSSPVAASTNTSTAASVQASLTEIQAGQLSLSQQPVSHAEQQLQQLQKQQLELQQQHQQQQQQNHHTHSKTSNHYSHQNALAQHYNSITHHHNQIPTMPNPAIYPHHIKTAQPPILGHSYEVTANVDELIQFAEAFKQHRKEMGFSQKDVSQAIRKLYGNKYSDPTISNFEALKLSFQKMCELKPLLQKWLEDAESSHTNPGSLTNQMTTTEPIERPRKKRTYIHLCVRAPLEKAFLQNPKPTSEDIGMLAKNLAMEKEVVRIWFENRRQKEKEINPSRTAKGNPTITESAHSNMFASIAATGNPTITESAHSYMFESMANIFAERTQGNSCDTENEASSSPSLGVSSPVAFSTSTSAAASLQASLREIQAAHLSLSQVPEITQHISSDTANGTFSLSRFGVSTQDATSTSMSAAGSVQAALTAIQPGSFSFSQVQQAVSHAAQCLEDVNSSVTNPGSQTNPMTTPGAIGRCRKKRTYKKLCVIEALENVFLKNPYPTREERAILEESLAMGKKEVCYWFWNRRRKEKKINRPSAAMRSPTITESAPSKMFA